MKMELHFGDVKGEQYEALIKYCCATCDYFMLVYRVKRTKALRGLQKDFLNRLRKYSVKSRMDWGWAGTPCEFDERFDYRVCFYKIALGAEELLLEAEHLYGFDGEDFPQDLAFFRGNYCFLYTRTGDECSSVVDPTKQDVAFLKERGIVYQRIDHETLMTIEACKDVDKVLDAVICKNLFLCNRQETNFYLLLLPGDKKFKTKEVSSQLGVARLSFGNETYMEKFLDITPGSVSILGLMNDKENHVQLLIDEDLLKEPYIGCHPCINTSSLKINMKDMMEKIIPAMKHEPIFVKLGQEE